jgi:hypothetical protein
MATAQTDHDKFRFWFPFDLEKAGEVEPGDGDMFAPIKGIVSSERRDEDGEIVRQDGIDWSYFKSMGKLTYGHPATVANVIGEPIEVTPTTLEDGTAAHAMKGRLFLIDELGSKVAKKARTMQKSGARARLGLSVEGHVLERDKNDPKTIKRCKVITVAVDANPKNPDAQMELAASLGVPFSPDTNGAAADAATPLVEPPAPATGGLSKADLQCVRILRKFPDWSWQGARAFLQSVSEVTQ